jgi:7-cyano-7-deazaguanine synthase in queuosine biosynthesis
MKGSKGDMLSPGYYEVLYKKDDLFLYKKIRKTYAERINQAVNAETKSKVERLFIASFNYYLVKGENVKSIKRVGEIIKLYPSLRKEIRQLIREKNLDQKADRDHAFKEIIKFVEFTNPTKK